MLYHEYILYKVPFDSSYVNVPFLRGSYDNYRNELARLFRIYYPYKSFNFGTDENNNLIYHSLNVSEDSFSCVIEIPTGVVSGDTKLDLAFEDYNYIIFSTMFGRRGYFINGYRTLNDTSRIVDGGTEYYTNVELILQNDVWFNSIDYVKSDNNIHTITSLNYDNSFTADEYSINYSFSLPSPITTPPSSTEKIIYTNNDVLWLKVLVENGVLKGHLQGEEGPESGIEQLPESSYGINGKFYGTTVLYIPVGYMQSGHINTLYPISRCRAFDRNKNGEVTLTVATPSRISSILKNQYVISATFTYLSPFNTVGATGSLLTLGNADHPYWCYTLADDSGNGLSGITVIGGSEYNDDYFKEISFTNTNNSLWTTSEYISDFVMSNEYASYYANYKSIFTEFSNLYVALGNNKIPLLTTHRISKITLRCEPLPFGVLYQIDVLDSDGNYINLENNINVIPDSGSLVLSKDQMELYLRNNASSLQTSIQIKQYNALRNVRNSISENRGKFSGEITEPLSKGDIVGAAVGAFKATAKEISHVMHDAIDTGVDYYFFTKTLRAQMEDLANQRDDYTIPSTLISNSPLYDRPMLIVESVIDASPQFRDMALTMQKCGRRFLFGSNINLIISTNLNATYFTFIQSPNYNISESISNHDRGVLSSIFNSGVRVWYLDNFYLNTSQSSRREMIKCNPMINNPSYFIKRSLS